MSNLEYKYTKIFIILIIILVIFWIYKYEQNSKKILTFFFRMYVN